MKRPKGDSAKGKFKKKSGLIVGHMPTEALKVTNNYLVFLRAAAFFYLVLQQVSMLLAMALDVDRNSVGTSSTLTLTC